MCLSCQRSPFIKLVNNKYASVIFKEGVIIDVAGGRGDLSFELATKFGLNCVIVDPREQKFKRWQFKYMKKHEGVLLPTHLQQFFDEGFFVGNQHIVLGSVKLVTGR